MQYETTSPDDLMERGQVARMLRISLRKLDQLNNEGVLPRIVLGKRCVRYRRSDVLAALDRLTVGGLN